MRCKETIIVLQFLSFSRIERLYIAIHNKLIHVQDFKTNLPRKIDENYSFLAFRLMIN